MRRFGLALGVVVVAALGLYGAAYVYYHARSPVETCVVMEDWGGDERLHRPMQLTWSDGLIYVADTDDRSVKQYRPDGILVARWADFERPVAAAVAEGVVYVADFTADHVVKLSSDGDVLARWGGHGTGPGEFDAPAGVAVDRRGNVYVSDFYNHRIQKLDSAGAFLVEWGGEGRTRGHFRYPTGIAVGDRGEVFVADAFNHRVQVFTPEGKYLRQWGGVGFGLGSSWPGWFFLAKEIALSPEGDVHVVDALNGRLQKFTPQGDLLAIWDPENPELAYPSGVAVGPDGTVFVSEFYGNRIHTLQCGRQLDTRRAR